MIVLDILDALQKKHEQNPRLRDFFAFAAQIPPSLTYQKIFYSLRRPERVHILRREFKKMVFRQNLYRWFGENYGGELVTMGIPNREVDSMISSGTRPKDHRGERLDFSIDHIQSLSIGGKNSLTNFCFLPGKLNHFKGILEDLQITQPDGTRKPEGTLVTLVPKRVKGRYNAVPYIEGGYPPRISNKGVG
jgi:hypothetical protein